MPITEIERAALGRVAKIGALYDARTDNFLGDNLFKSDLKDKYIETSDLRETYIKLVTTDNLQEKFKKLDVETELQVSLLSGLVELDRPGAYSEKQSKSAKTQSLLYKLKTVNEEITIRQTRDKINKKILSQSKGQSFDATHVVVGIDWGGVCSITTECGYENKDGDVTVVKQAVSGELETLKELIDGKESTTASCDDQNMESHKKFNFKCNFDFSDPDKDLLVTFKDAVEQARNFPSIVKAKNNGKGVPLTYMLMPLDVVVNKCKINTQIQIQYRAINGDVISKCVQVMEKISKQKQTFRDIQNDLHAYADYIAEGSPKGIDDILKKFEVEESGFKAGLQDLVKKVRSGCEDVSSLEAFLSKQLGDTRYHDQITGFKTDVNKVNSIKSWKSQGVIYIGRKDKLIVGKTTYTYILYKTADEYDKNQEFFWRLQKTHAQDNENFEFVIVDQDIREDLWPTSKTAPTIHKFVKGKKISEDLYAEEGQDSEMCLIQIPKPTANSTRPPKRAPVKLRCPNALSGNGQCTGNLVIWVCSKCKHVVEYGIDTHLFYCKCGESDPKEALFRCSESDHGMDYVKSKSDILLDELSVLEPMKEKNILILGETGVGKSTWINGLVNYLYFADMEEATKANDFHVLIPSSFTIAHLGKEKKIIIGESDANENMETTGKSATKEPRSYIFYAESGQRVCLIDTPGVGDSDGIEEDKRNFGKILSHLAFYDEIHAVCILLKPNNARLTALFRFCIQELLAHLHSSAKHNIVFCFTNARATHYKPGDTLPALNTELKKREVGIQATPQTYFCFDNDSFRFLACLKNGVRFTQKEETAYAESWNKCVDEYKRLFTHINTLRPHIVKNTLNMNIARRIIVAMSKPLAEVAKTIEQNVQEGNEAKGQIDLCDKDMESLKADLKFSGYDLDRVELDYPRTVCADSQCVKYVPVGKSRIQNTVYSQFCHPRCFLDDIPTETTNDPRLVNCWCVGQDGNCHQCRHHYTMHMHITYDLTIFTKEFLSEEVQAQIKQKETVKEAIEAFRKAIDTKIKELKEEKQTIITTSAKYATFLKANAIIPYNDAVGDYLDMSIEHEKNKAKEIRDDEFLLSMQRMKREYEHEKGILVSATGEPTSETINTPEEVKKLQDKLFGLKHMGQTFKNIFDGISFSNSDNDYKLKEKFAPVRQSYQEQSKSPLT